MKTTIVLLSLLIGGLIWFVEPWGMRATKHTESVGISQSSPGDKVSIGPVVSTQERESAAKTTNLPMVESISKEQSTPILSDQVQRALADIKRTLEAIELANSEVIPSPKNATGTITAFKIKEPQKEDLERASEAVGRARRFLSTDKSEDAMFRDKAQLLINDFTNYKWPTKVVFLYQNRETGKTNFNVMMTAANATSFFSAKGDILFSGGSIDADRTDWASGGSRSQKRYGYLFKSVYVDPPRSGSGVTGKK